MKKELGGLFFIGVLILSSCIFIRADIFGINWGSSEGEISIGTISLIYMAFLGLLTPLRKFSWAIRHFSKSLTDMDDLFNYGRVSNEIKDKRNAEENPRQERSNY